MRMQCMERLWIKHKIPIKMKCQVYRAIVLPSLLYGFVARIFHSMQADHVQANMMRDLKSIMDVSWKIKIANVRKIVELYQ